MSVLKIESQRLNRTVFVCNTKEEAREVWREHPRDRGSIFLASEVRLMKGITDEVLETTQMVKDVFPGATVQRFDPPKGEFNELAS